MTCQTRLSSMFGATMFMALAAGGPLALADIPPALDRLPTNAGVVVAIPNIQKLQDAMKVMQDTFQIDPQEATMGVGQDVLNANGVNKGGSMAIALVFPNDEAKDDKDRAEEKDGDKDGDDANGDDQDGDDQDGDDADEAEGMGSDDEPMMFVVVPVSDYKAFVTGLKGDPSAKIAELHTENQDLFAKDIGGGYAALSEGSDALMIFDGKAGSLPTYKALLGKTGASLAESSDLMVFANIQILGPKIKEGMAGVRQQMEMMGQDNAGAASGFMQAFGDAMTTDGQAAMFGMDMEPEGLRLETAASFKDGSPTAGMLQTVGNASRLLGSLPAASQGFLFAGAFDSSVPALRKILETYATPDTKAAMAAADAESWMGWVKQSDGAAGIIGTSPALMGGPGFFVNTMLFAKSANPAGLIEQFKQSMTTVNGKTENGVTLSTSYKAGASTVAGAAVDEWNVGMKMDPNSPSAQQAQMVIVTLFGPKGSPSGYVAQAKSGVVMTMSKNSALMESALNAADGKGENFASDAGVKAVAARLPEGRSFEVYVGVKDILNMVMPFAAMFGAGPLNVDIPADLAPIGMGGTTSNGTLRVSTFMPTAVMKTFAALSEELNGAGGDVEGGEDQEEPQSGGRPRF